MSGGRIKIQFYGAGELIPAAEGFDAVSSGTVEMNYANSYFWTGKSFAAQYFTAVPFGLNFQGFNGWYYDGGGARAVARGLRPLQSGADPVRQHRRADDRLVPKEIKTVDDLKGLKMRIPGLAGRVYSELGVDVRLMPRRRNLPGARARRDRRRRIRRPLSSTASSACTRSPSTTTRPAGTRWRPRASSSSTRRSGTSLPPDLKAIVENACAACNVISEAWCQKNNAEAMEDLVKNQGVIAQPLPDAVVKALRAANDQDPRRGGGQGSGHQEGPRLLHGLQGQVRRLGRPTASPSTTPRSARADVTSAERLAGGIDAFIDLVGRVTSWLALALALVMGAQRAAALRLLASARSGRRSSNGT